MTCDLTVHDVCGGLIGAHTSQKNEKVCFTGLTDGKMIHAEAGRRTA